MHPCPDPDIDWEVKLANVLECLPNDILAQDYRAVNALANLKAGAAKGRSIRTNAKK